MSENQLNEDNKDFNQAIVYLIFGASFIANTFFKIPYIPTLFCFGVIWFSFLIDKNKSDLTHFFWIYYFAFGIGISLINRIIMSEYYEKWTLIAPTFYFIFSGYGVYERANEYAIERKEKGKGYGWSIFTKVCLIFNFFSYCLIWYKVLS